MAASTIERMKSLAKLGRTIIFTIHQPSSDIFRMFDKICLLSKGCVAFLGTPDEANSFFEQYNYFFSKITNFIFVYNVNF
jgi:ABC-type multidrug transport system ATPase subunit